MKKIFFASVAAMLFSLTAMAQTPATPVSDKKQDMKDVRKDIRDIRKDKSQRRKEWKEGDKAEAKELTKDIQMDKKGIRKDAKDLREDGMKHPIHRADKQIHRANMRKRG